MSIELPLWIVVGQWMLLFALGLLVIVMYRQLGTLMKFQDQGDERYGLPIGTRAPAFEYTMADDAQARPMRFEPGGTWSLLLFADPGCASCETALQAIEKYQAKLKSQLRILAVTSLEKERVAAIEAFSTSSTAIACVSRDMPMQLYRTNITPFLFLIDEQGIIQSRGVATNKAAIRKIMKRIEQNVSSLAPVTS